MAVVVVERGAERGTVVPIPATGVLLIGREAVCALRLTDVMVSRRHCALGWERGELWLKDLQSSNGTWRNAERLPPGGAVRVGVGDRIRLGLSLLSVLDDTDDAAHDELTGTTVGGYQVLARLGAGSTCTVYRAVQSSLEREVALKVLAPALAREPAVRHAFFEQARAAGALVHPHLVAVYDVGQVHGRPAFSMELLPGGSLAARLERGARLPPAEVLAVGLAVARALAFAAERGLVHGRLTPGRLYATAEGTYKLGGLGFRPPPGLAELGAHTAPELLGGLAPTPASDLYALGALLYELLAGRPPFAARRTVLLREAIAHQPPPPLGELVPQAPAELLALIERLLAKDPAARPASADAVAAALMAAARGRGSAQGCAATPTAAPPPSPLTDTPQGVARAAPRSRAQAARRWALGLAGALLATALGLWSGRARWPGGAAPPEVAGAAGPRPEPAAAAAPAALARAQQAQAALLDAEQQLRERPTDLQGARERFAELATRFADVPAVREQAARHAERLAALAAQLQAELAARQQREQAAAQALEQLAAAVPGAPPEALAELRARLHALEREHGGLAALTRTAQVRAALAERCEQLLAELEREVAAALAQEQLVQARAALVRAGSWQLGAAAAPRLAALGEALARAEVRRAERAAGRRAERRQAELQALAEADAAELRRALAYRELHERLAALAPQLTDALVRERAAARLLTLAAQAAARAHLERHLAEGRLPRPQLELAPGMPGEAVASNAAGVVLRGVAQQGIEVVRPWAGLEPAELERLFAPLPLSPRERYGLAHILLDRGAVQAAAAAFGEAARAAAAAGEEAVRALAAQALAGEPPGRP
ncbi:MAG: hypothetical protein KatS3mg102_1053 [Planctomycetota bacterium]|nr:MAG: hypothetical protein KatS3mg102_1053 [Planctomycetota bacterium]